MVSGANIAFSFFSGISVWSTNVHEIRVQCTGAVVLHLEITGVLNHKTALMKPLSNRLTGVAKTEIWRVVNNHTRTSRSYSGSHFLCTSTLQSSHDLIYPHIRSISFFMSPLVPSKIPPLSHYRLTPCQNSRLTPYLSQPPNDLATTIHKPIQCVRNARLLTEFLHQRPRSPQIMPRDTGKKMVDGLEL